MTMSCVPSSFGPGAASPLVIRTRAMRASVKTMPKKERLPSPGEAGTKLLKISPPSVPKHSMRVLAWRFPFLLPGPLPSGRSTSVKTAPKPLTFAGTVPLDPGTKNERLGDVAVHWGEEPQRAEGAEDGAVGRIVEERSQAALGPA